MRARPRTSGADADAVARARGGEDDESRHRARETQNDDDAMKDAAVDDDDDDYDDDDGDIDDPSAARRERSMDASGGPRYASARDAPFRALARACERVQRERGRKKANAARRYAALDAFHDVCLVSTRDGTRCDAFDAYRLLIPTLDKERETYRLKHDALAKCVVSAFDMARASEDAKTLEDWKQKGGGNFPQAVREVLERGHLQGREGDADVRELTIGEVNDTLDELAACESKHERAATLRKLFGKMDAVMVKWACAIILKETKLRMGDKAIMRHYHRDAEDLFDWTSDLRRVCEDLPRRDVRLKRADINVGEGLINPQLALRKNTADAIMKTLRGRQFIIETKFDGERIQLHKDGEIINYWTRNMNDFGPRGYDVMNGLFRHLPKRCILDGELLVWNKLRETWHPFGAIKTLIKAANLRKSKDEVFPLSNDTDDRDDGDDIAGYDPKSSKYEWYQEYMKKLTYGDLELVYVPFDILYIGDESVRHLQLVERHAKLREHVHPVSAMCGNIKARILLATPDCEFSKIGSTKQDIERALLEAIEAGDEGLVIKDLNSEWIPGDRSGNWMKIKPDYCKSEDLDVLLIGGYYGAGELRGGKISQFLVGIIESTNDPTSAHGIKIMSFCKVGTGISATELDDLRNRLGDYMHREKPREMDYNVTDAYSERPDVWIWPPQRSVVVRVKGDIRCIRSMTYATGYSLRFPRVTGIRYDKTWSDILTNAELKQIIEEDRPNIAMDMGEGHMNSRKRTRAAALTTLLPAHLMPVDVSGVVPESEVFKSLQIHIVNCESREQKQELFKAIIARGGRTSEMWHSDVTHSVAANRDGAKFIAASHHGDVYTIDWLKQCIQQNRIVTPRPRHRLNLATSTWYGSNIMDRYGDDHAIPCNEEDIRALLHQVGDQAKRWETSEVPAMVELTREYPNLLKSMKYCTFSECVFEIDDSCDVQHKEWMSESEHFRLMLHEERFNVELRLRLFGGTMAPEGRSGTHIVRMNDDSVREEYLDDGRVLVSNGWVTKRTRKQSPRMSPNLDIRSF